MDTTTLAWHDLQWCLRRAPKQLLGAMKKHGQNLIVAGGFLRSCVTNDDINDVDCFCPTKDLARVIAFYLAGQDAKQIVETDNAFTIKGLSLPVQIIHRWAFSDPTIAIQSFDFTIARAAFWWSPIENPSPGQVAGEWKSVCGTTFYSDLAGRRLIYCAPVRNEDAGGSLLRVLKFYQRGYRIPLDSMGAVISRLMKGVRWEDIRADLDEETEVARVITGLLREVDPNLDPRHIAHLPSETARDQQKESQEGAEDFSPEQKPNE